MIGDMVHHENDGDVHISYSDVCEWVVARFNLPCTGYDFWMASPTGELTHVFAAVSIFLEERRLKRRMNSEEIHEFFKRQAEDAFRILYPERKEPDETAD